MAQVYLDCQDGKTEKQKFITQANEKDLNYIKLFTVEYLRFVRKYSITRIDYSKTY